MPKCDLRGPVRKAVMTTHFLDSESVYRFDREGKLISIDGDPGEAEFRLKTWIFESNSIGQITKVDYTLLIVGTHPEWHYTYNEDGDVIRIDDATSSAVSDNEPRPYAVEINERDAYGNWTKRTLKGEGEEPQTETRTIRYYKD